MSSVDLVMSEFWAALYAQQRRALAVFAYCDELAQRLAEIGYVPWPSLSTDERMKIVRALPHFAELAELAAACLARSRAALRAEAGPTLRESLTQQVAETIGTTAERLERNWQLARQREGKR